MARTLGSTGRLKHLLALRAARHSRTVNELHSLYMRGKVPTSHWDRALGRFNVAREDLNRLFPKEE